MKRWNVFLAPKPRKRIIVIDSNDRAYLIAVLNNKLGGGAWTSRIIR